MKTTTAFRFIIAAMAAIPVLASCQKERADETPDTPAQTDEVRVITLQFANSTKTALDSDGVTPKFENGDQILLSNGTDAPETATVSVAGGKATCPTKLNGTLTAVYPASAAKLNGNVIEEVLVPTEQDGTFKSANICMAENIDASANFVNQTALLEITPPSGPTSITIKSLKPVVDGVARTGTAKAINTEGNSAEDKLVIKVSVSGGKAYVSLVPGVIFSDLSFDAGETIGIKGIPTSKAGSGDAAAANTKYTIDGTNWHPYVTIGGKKWATMNIGATDTDPFGTYFFWGSVEKVYTGLSSNTFTFQTNNPNTTRYTGTWTPGSGFSQCNTPYYNGSAYTKYTGASIVLELADDVAYANWGGPWRMPTGGTVYNTDFTALAKAAASYSSGELSYTQTITTSGEPSSQGVYYYKVSGETVGVYFVDSSLKKLFFPAAHYGLDIRLMDIYEGPYGFYWSSSLYTRGTKNACTMYFTNTLVLPQINLPRSDGLSVRPVCDL